MPEVSAPMTRIDTALAENLEGGWGPIAALADLTAGLFGGQRLGFCGGRLGRAERLWSLRPRPAARQDAVLLAFLSASWNISHLRRSPVFRAGYRMVAVWIVDSFWDENPLRRADFAGIDLICITRADEIEYYRRHLGDRVLALNWGADVLGRGSAGGARPVDLLRVGRQPPAWDDDQQTARLAAGLGLNFAGRPPLYVDPAENQHRLMAAYAGAKYIVAHSNLAAPDYYTHKTKEYVTGRWTDALANGATVAGVQPKADDSFRRLFWPGATLDFDRIDLRHNLEAVAEAVAGWTPAQARHNHLMALERLDWRHGLKQISDRISVRSEALEADLAEIGRRLRAG